MLEEQLLQVRAAVAEAAKAAGRDPQTVKLLAVSKTFPASDIQQAWEAGQRAFGENRVQELSEKAPVLPADCEWHLIGHLQHNKVKQALEHAAWIHSVDSLSLLRRLNLLAEQMGKSPKILLEVNVSGEESKFGLKPSEVRDLVLDAQGGPCRLCGLMTMAPLGAEEAVLHSVFGGLRTLRDEVSAATGQPLPELSMGMSGDFRVAIAEGATIVRIGTAIFGHR
jgi:hypothetical protein